MKQCVLFQIRRGTFLFSKRAQNLLRLCTVPPNREKRNIPPFLPLLSTAFEINFPFPVGFQNVYLIVSDSEIQKESILREEIKVKITFLSGFFFSRFAVQLWLEKKGVGEMKIMEKYSPKPRGVNEIMTNFPGIVLLFLFN